MRRNYDSARSLELFSTIHTGAAAGDAQT